MSSKYRFIFEAIAIGWLLVVVDTLVALLLLLSSGMGSVLYAVSNFLVLEFGVLLILGGCLMARQPLEDKGRFDASGRPTMSWRMAIYGRELLTMSVFVLVFSLLFAFAALYVQT